MWVSTKAQYGLRALIEIARRDDEAVPLKDVAERQGISQHYLEQIASNLRRAGCHGQAAAGGIGPALRGEINPGNWTVEQLTTTLREGRAPNKTLGQVMPRFTATQVSDQDIANLHAYFKTLE